MSHNPDTRQCLWTMVGSMNNRVSKCYENIEKCITKDVIFHLSWLIKWVKGFQKANRLRAKGNKPYIIFRYTKSSLLDFTMSFNTRGGTWWLLRNVDIVLEGMERPWIILNYWIRIWVVLARYKQDRRTSSKQKWQRPPKRLLAVSNASTNSQWLK